MALQAQIITKAAEITKQTSDLYTDMQKTLANLNNDAAGKMAAIQGSIDWVTANPTAPIDPAVVTEMNQYKAFMVTLSGILATVPPVPNV